MVQERNWNWVTHYLYSKQKPACSSSVRKINSIPQSAQCKHRSENCLKQRSVRALNSWHIQQECAWHMKDCSPTHSQDYSSCKLQRPSLNLFKQTKTRKGEEKCIGSQNALSFSLPIPISSMLSPPTDGHSPVILRRLATCSTNPQTGQPFYNRPNRSPEIKSQGLCLAWIGSYVYPKPITGTRWYSALIVHIWVSGPLSESGVRSVPPQSYGPRIGFFPSKAKVPLTEDNGMNTQQPKYTLCPGLDDRSNITYSKQ